MAGKIGSHGGSQSNTRGGTTLDTKNVRKVHLMAWKGPKNGQFLAKTAVFGHKRPQTLQMAGKSGSNVGTQWNTCVGTTLDEKLVRKVHLMAWKGPKMANFGPKPSFLAISGP